MSLLCQVIDSKIGEILAQESISKWEIISDKPDSCEVLTDTIRLGFYIDNRGGMVTSNIEYINEPDEHRDRIPSYIAADLFPDIKWTQASKINTILEAITYELENIRNVLAEIRINRISPRDLFFFFMGHNAGYTIGSSTELPT
jgi:hypothetical protein